MPQLSTTRPRVLIYGSFQSPSTPCGVTAALQSCLASPLAQDYALEAISTYRPHASRSLVARLAFGVWLGLRSLGQILRRRAAVVDIHAVSDRDFLKHIAVLFAARFSRTHCILRIHGGDFERVYARESRTKRALIRLALRLPQHVVVLSQSWQDVIAQIEPRAKLAIVPNSIDCDTLQKIAEQRNPVSHRALLLGNLCARKGHFDALEAAARVRDVIPDFELCLAGVERDAGAFAALAQRAEALQLHEAVQFLGPVFDGEKARILAKAQILILPSHTENMPLAIMEGMACALPIVATKVGAIPEMIKDGVTGFLIDPRDPGALAERMLALLHNTELCRAVGERAQRHARLLWDPRVVAAQNAALYAS